MSIFSQRLTYLRKDIKHKDRKEMAALLKVSYSTYSNWENGRRQPAIETIREVASKLNTSTDYLTGLTSDPTPHDAKSGIVDIDKNPVTLAYDGTVATDDDMEIIKSIIARHKRNKKNGWSKRLSFETSWS